jgi:Zn-finger nucleic acid-binding protein
MDKTRVGPRGELVLDACRRCGGIWFEFGEVQRLKRLEPQTLWDRVGLRDAPLVTQCHECHAPLDRSAAACPTCARPNTIACPVCDRTLEVHTHDGVRLDACRVCKGVWFDHVELAAIWTLALDRVSHRRRSAKTSSTLDADDGSLLVVHALAYSPEIVVYGARAAGYAVAASGEALANAPEAAVGLFAGAGEAAASVFEAVLDIIGEMFS